MFFFIYICALILARDQLNLDILMSKKLFTNKYISFCIAMPKWFSFTRRTGKSAWHPYLSKCSTWGEVYLVEQSMYFVVWSEKQNHDWLGILHCHCPVVKRAMYICWFVWLMLTASTMHGHLITHKNSQCTHIIHIQANMYCTWNRSSCDMWINIVT